MRRVCFLLSLILLVAGLFVLRSIRFERDLDASVIGLADLRAIESILPGGVAWSGSGDSNSLNLVAGGGNQRLALEYDLTGLGPVEALHVRYRMKAKNLVCGPEEWEDGRVLVGWRSVKGGAGRETDPIGSLRHDEDSGEVSVVVRPSSPPAMPTLRIENLGLRGAFVISKMELTPVHERMIWRVGRWVLLLAWFLWLYLVLHEALTHLFWRRCLASAIWVVMGVFFVFPGPWKNLRPMIIPFDLGKASELAVAAEKSAVERFPVPESKPRPSAPNAVKPLGKVQPTENWLLKAKRVLVDERPLLHMLLLFAPALAFAWLLGRRQAVILAAALAVSIEAAQTAFGFGFDLWDVGDLASDALGIALALWVYGWKSRRPESRRSKVG